MHHGIAKSIHTQIGIFLACVYKIHSSLEYTKVKSLAKKLYRHIRREVHSRATVKGETGTAGEERHVAN